MAHPSGSRRSTGAGRPSRGGLTVRPVNLLLVIPLIGTLVPFFYNRTSPTIGGMPFFYWYQLVWIAVSVVLTTIVFLVTRSER